MEAKGGIKCPLTLFLSFSFCVYVLRAKKKKSHRTRCCFLSFYFLIKTMTRVSSLFSLFVEKPLKRGSSKWRCACLCVYRVCVRTCAQRAGVRSIAMRGEGSILFIHRNDKRKDDESAIATAIACTRACILTSV